MTTIEISDDVQPHRVASMIHFGLIRRELILQTTSGARYTGVQVYDVSGDMLRFTVEGFVNALDGSNRIELKVSAIDRIEVVR